MQSEDGFIRTPLGGFINYSDNPNCDNSNFGSDSQLELDDTRLNMYLWTSKNIKKGEELTLKYKRTEESFSRPPEFTKGDLQIN
mgnify:CR=1 FL=1